MINTRRTQRASYARVGAVLFILTVAPMAVDMAVGARDAMGSAQATAKPKIPSVVLVTQPNPPVAGANAFTATIKDAAGNPVVGADVTVTFVMPAMPSMNMPEMKSTLALKAVGDRPADAGQYTGKGSLRMAGRWNVTVTAKIKDKVVAEEKLTLTAK